MRFVSAAVTLFGSEPTSRLSYSGGMMISPTRQSENAIMIAGAYADHDGLCHFCTDPIVDHLVWHHLDDSTKEGAIGDLRNGTGAKLERELPKVVPAHRKCHDEYERELAREKASARAR